MHGASPLTLTLSALLHTAWEINCFLLDPMLGAINCSIRNVPFYSNNPAHRYYLATDPVTGDLYVSDTNTRRIYRPKSLTGAKDLTKNVEVIGGTGEQCLPFDEARCGDGGKAVEATLMSPKGKRSSPSVTSKIIQKFRAGGMIMFNY